MLPPDSKTNKLLRYGSRQGPRRRPENDRFKCRNSLPTIKNCVDLDQDNSSSSTQASNNSNSDGESESQDSDESEAEAKITVHRTLS